MEISTIDITADNHFDVSIVARCRLRLAYLVSHVEIDSEDVGSAIQFCLVFKNYTYELHTIKNADGRPITMEASVSQVHSYPVPAQGC